MSDTAVQQSAASESVTEGSLLDQVMANSRMAPADEGYDVARKGVATFIANLLQSDEKGQPVNKALVDQMVVELDR
ncbi:type VI secretion system contractile sheath large subunit, partial [Pantoea sp. SIMBA_133]